MKQPLAVGILVLGCGVAPAQTGADGVPLYRVTIVGRTAKAVNYLHRGGPTKLDFKGTVLLTEGRGEATVESKQGATQIDAKFERLEPPTRFGRQYLTYVLWAITPEGRAVNLGEVVGDHSNKARLKTAAELQAFALVLTAEPYFAVTQPSDVVVMENVVRPDTAGRIEEIEAKYELLPRGHYTFDQERVVAAGGPKVSLDQYEALLELYQARNAVQIARASSADRYAGATYRKAEQLLRQAEDSHAARTGVKTVVMNARQAAQTAEDARLIAVRRQDEEREAAARQARLDQP